jgi:hypothetical protein
LYRIVCHISRTCKSKTKQKVKRRRKERKWYTRCSTLNPNGITKDQTETTAARKHYIQNANTKQKNRAIRRTRTRSAINNNPCKKEEEESKRKYTTNQNQAKSIDPM